MTQTQDRLVEALQTASQERQHLVIELRAIAQHLDLAQSIVTDDLNYQAACEISRAKEKTGYLLAHLNETSA